MLKELFDFILKSLNHAYRYANYWMGFKNGELLKAAKLGNTAAVLDLLSQGTYINCKDKDGNTPLHIAAHHGRMQTVDQLLKNKANIKAVNYNKDTALHVAASAGNTATALLLLEKGAILTTQNKDKDSPLHTAVNKGKLDTLVSLIKNNPPMESAQYNSLLKNAVIAEKIDIITWLINHHPNRYNIDGYELLKTSVEANSPETLQFMIRCFPATKTQLNELLNLAINNIDIKNVHALLSNGAEINSPSKPILTVVKNGQIDLFNHLMAFGASISVNDNEGNNALHLAAKNENYGMLQEILNRRLLDPKATNNEGQTPKDIIDERIQQLMVQLNQHREDHIFSVEQLSKKHHLETESIIRFNKNYSDDEKRAIYEKRALKLENEVVAMNKFAQKHESVIAAKIRKLSSIANLLFQAKDQFQHNFMPMPEIATNLFPEPSAPSVDGYMMQNPAYVMPYYNLNKNQSLNTTTSTKNNSPLLSFDRRYKLFS